MARTADPASRLDWSAFFDRYRPLALRLAQGIVGRPEPAEDLVQEAFRSIFERSRDGAVSFDSGDHVRNYFLRAVHNLAVDALRTARPHDGPELSGSLPAARDGIVELEERELDERRRQAVRRAIAGLRPPEADAIHLRYVEGLTYREMCARTRESISTLQGRVEVALDKLRRKIGKEGAPS